MKIGIIAAMASEREQLARLVVGMRTERHGLFEYTIGQLGGNTLYIMECGIGKVNAAVGASELMARMQPDVVVSTGVAGGIDAKAGACTKSGELHLAERLGFRPSCIQVYIIVQVRHLPFKTRRVGKHA